MSKGSKAGRHASAWAGAVVAFLLAAPIALAVDEAPLRFDAHTALKLGPEPVAVTVINDTEFAWSLSITADLATGDDGLTVVSVPVNGAPASIIAGGTARFSVGPAPGGVTTGTGFVVATATTDDQTIVARRALSLSPGIPVPAVKTWSGDSHRFTPFLSKSRTDTPDLPLTGTTCGSLTEGSVVLTTGSRTAELEYTCTERVDSAAISFTADNGRIGDYTGTLKVGETEVALTLRRTTHWIWPLIAIFIGLAPAAAHQAWVNNLRPLKLAGNRLSLIGEAAVAAQNQFEGKAGTHPFRAYSFDAGGRAELARIQTLLDELAPPGWRWLIPRPKADHEERYKETVKEMAALDTTVAEWPVLADRLRELKDGIEKLEHHGLLAPHLLARANSIVAPPENERPLDLKAARELLEEVPKTTAALRLLPPAVELEQALAKVDPGRDFEHPDYETFHQATRLYRQARAELAELKSASEVEKREVDALLQTTRALVMQLKPFDPSITGQAVDEEWDKARAFVLAPIALIQRAVRAVASANGRMRAVDFAWLLVAVAIAAWTGLAALYFDKAWGEWDDYVALIVWAFATTAVLTPVLTALENLVAGPLQLKKSDDTAKQE